MTKSRGGKGSKKSQNYADVIYGWSLKTNLIWFTLEENNEVSLAGLENEYRIYCDTIGNNTALYETADTTIQSISYKLP